MLRHVPSVLALVAMSLALGCKSEANLIGTNGNGDELVEPPPCITVTPPSVDFGDINVTVDSPGTELVSIGNDCEGDLEIYGLDLDDAGAPFVIGSLGSILLQQGDITDFSVTFDPQTSATWATKVLIDSNDPEVPTATVDLTGNGIAPIIQVTPVKHDFGTPFIGCEVSQPIEIANVGNADLLVTSLQWATGSNDLDLDNNEQVVPFTVPPSSSVEVFVNYMGLDEFEDLAYMTVESNDPWTPEVLASMTGTALKFGDNIDVFEQPLKSETDILVVVDNSCSMAEEQASLAANFEAFVDTIVAADGDYQLAVITTDNAEFRGDIITPDTTDPVGEFQTQALAGTGGSGDERPMQMAYQATQSGGDAGPGSDFLRDGAMLAIVVIADEPDSSTMTPEDYVDYWLSIKDEDEDLVRFHVIGGDVPTPACGTAAAASTPLDETASLTGGEFISVCSDWGESMEAVALGSVSVNDSFLLTQRPVPQTVEVAVDGIDATVGWEYDLGTNSVVFESDYIPSGGSTIEIEYELMPDCEG